MHIGQFIKAPAALRQDPIDKIYIHKKPDLDEIVASWEILNWGENRFPGSISAEVVVVDPREIKETYAELLAKKILCVGFGGGPFDEHPEDGDDGRRIVNQSSAALVANALGIRNIPGIKEVVDYAVEKDHSAVTVLFELGIMLKSAVRYLPDMCENDSELENKMNSILAAAYVLLDGHVVRVHKWIECEQDYEKSHRFVDILWPNGKKCRVGSVLSSNAEMQAFCRSKKGGLDHVVLISQPPENQKKGGYFQIYFQHREVDDELVWAIIRAIRYEERRKKGRNGNLPLEVINADGAIAGAEEWYFELKKRVIFNGNMTQSRAQSKLTRDELERIISKAIEDYFDWLRN
jgi:hypothetical protein